MTYLILKSAVGLIGCKVNSTSILVSNLKDFDVDFIRSPNRWSCLPTAFAMACNVSLNEFLYKIGHDGSDILWPDLGEPRQRRAFHLTECVHAAVTLGKRPVVLPFVAQATADGKRTYEIVYETEVKHLMSKSDGVLLGAGHGGLKHAVAWKYGMVLDPSWGPYGLPSALYSPDTFIMI